MLVAVAGAALGACGWVWVRRHFAEIERLRGAVAVVSGDLSRTMPAAEESEAGAELAALHRSMSDLIGRAAAERQTPDERLTDVVAAVGGGLVVMTENGLISLINDAARGILGSRGTECGTSIYDVFSRRSLAEANEAAAAGEPAEVWIDTIDGRSLPARFAPLNRHGGAVIWIAEAQAASRGAIELALDLHDRPPEAAFADPDTPLDELPGIVVDTETTGLNVSRDRIISFGSVRVHGTHVYRAETHDILVNPAMPIPKRSIAVHGITDAMVAAAPTLDASWPDMRAALSGRVVIGHNIGFDAAILAREAERLGERWRPSALIDTLLLAAALEPKRKDLTLDGLAASYAIPVAGRHTALGDALVTAQLYVRLVDRLKAHGVVTVAQANGLAGKRTDLVTAQEQRGWLVAV
jgi:DNA polymerase-3 subunit epsilon